MVVVPDAMLDCAVAISSAIEPADDGLRLVAVGSTTDVSEVEAPVVAAIVADGDLVPTSLTDPVDVGRLGDFAVLADPAHVDAIELATFIDGYGRSCVG